LTRAIEWLFRPSGCPRLFAHSICIRLANLSQPF
jgi:hypothetical protein